MRRTAVSDTSPSYLPPFYSTAISQDRKKDRTWMIVQ